MYNNWHKQKIHYDYLDCNMELRFWALPSVHGKLLVKMESGLQFFTGGKPGCSATHEANHQKVEATVQEQSETC
jgi:hypothetical protein